MFPEPPVCYLSFLETVGEGCRGGDATLNHPLHSLRHNEEGLSQMRDSDGFGLNFRIVEGRGGRVTFLRRSECFRRTDESVQIALLNEPLRGGASAQKIQGALEPCGCGELIDAAAKASQDVRHIVDHRVVRVELPRGVVPDGGRGLNSQDAAGANRFVDDLTGNSQP